MHPAADRPGRARPTKLSRQLLALSEESGPLTMAHRGASEDHPENTLPAFEAALAAGAPMLELDFRQAADGELVVIHDAELDRTTDCANAWGRSGVEVASVALAELQGLDAGSWKDKRFAGTRIPALDATLRQIGTRAYTIAEHKAGDPQAIAALLRRENLFAQVLVQSFDLAWLQRLHELEADITTVAACQEPLSDEFLVAAQGAGASAVHWDARSLDGDAVHELHRRGLVVCVYTLNDDDHLVRGAEIGCDAITTDRPARLLDLVARGVVSRPARGGPDRQ